MARLSIEQGQGTTLKGIEYVTVRLSGLITTETSPRVDEVLFALAQKPGSRVVVDFGQVGYVNSTGLGQLIAHLDALTQSGGDMVLVNVIAEVKRVVKLLGIDKVLKLVPDEKAVQDYFDTGNTEMFEKVFDDVGTRPQVRKGKARQAPTKTQFPLRPQDAKVVYASNHKDIFAEILEMRWGNGTGKFSLVQSPSEIEKILRSQKPDLLIVDHQLADSGKICEELKKTKDFSLISVIRLYAKGHSADQVEGFYVRENEFVSEPFEVNELIALAESELVRAAKERKTFIHQIHFQFQNNEDDLEKAVDFIAQLIRQSSVDQTAAGELRTAVREAIDNAYRHGNKNQLHHKVYVNYVLDQEKVVISVEDEGEGFDSQYYIDLGREEDAATRARKQQESGRTGGLGIMLMMKCLDNIEYNGVGNLVKLTKMT